MKKSILCFTIIISSLFFSFSSKGNSFEPIKYVNPFIGTAGYGHTFPGAALPFGMVQLSPSTGASRDKAGYAYNSMLHGRESKTIIGFTHTNLSGTGINTASRYSNILMMPTIGPLFIEPGTESDPDSGYRSRFSHEFEEASPGYYQVLLQDYNINAELTVTERVGVHKYTFPKSNEGNIIIDITRERSNPDLHTDAYIEVVGENQIQGYTTVLDHTIGEPLTWYFFAEFSKPFDDFGTFVNSKPQAKRRVVKGGFGTGAFVNYSTKENEEIVVKVSLSFTGIEGAKRNMRKEATESGFDKIKKDAEYVWNKELSKINVSGGTTQNKVKFYTSLYHSLLFPRLFSDVDGAYYSHFKDEIIKEEKFRFHADFFLWDTYRTTHPLLNIIQPARQTELINSILATYDQGGVIPTQYFKNLYTQDMIGDHGSTMISDAYVKGIRGFDINKAFEGMMKNASTPGVPGRGRMGLETYKELGYVAIESSKESVSLTLEYALTDYALAQVAKDLGRSNEYNYLIKNSGNFKNLYDNETEFYRPRFSDRSWLPICDRRQSPEIVSSIGDSYYDCWNPWWIGVSPHRHYTESNAWQYLFYPQHDIHGLIDLMGGREVFTNRLDGLFHDTSSNEGPAYVGVTGAIGQYVHGNQPSFHVAYLYNYSGAPWKTQERVRGIMENLYGADEWGLPGNEDMGSMSSWFVFSAMGLYPVTPGSDHYTISSPLFEKNEINLDDFYNNNTFTIIAHNNSGDNKYIQSATLNGNKLERPWIRHSEIIKGGTLEFQMGPEPNKSWGSAPEMAPPSMSTE